MAPTCSPRQDEPNYIWFDNAPGQGKHIGANPRPLPQLYHELQAKTYIDAMTS